MQAQADERLAQTQLARRGDDDCAVHERGEERAREEEQRPGDRHPESDDDHGNDTCRERGVEEKEPPRLAVEVAERGAQSCSRAHPLTPAVVTPAMK